MLARYDKVLIPEMNLGQLLQLVRAEFLVDVRSHTSVRGLPFSTVELADGQHRVTAHAAQGEERARLWARWRRIDANLDARAALRSSETAVVVLEPQPTATR